MYPKGISGNYAGRPKGSKNRLSLLRELIEDAFNRNEDTAIKYLNAMFNNKRDFKWLCSLKASMEPRLKDSQPERQYSEIVIMRPAAPSEESVRITEGRTIVIDRCDRP